MNIILVIDRFEGKYAILETQDKTSLIFNFPRHLLPLDAKEGLGLRFNIDIANKETTRKRKRITGKLNRLKNKDQGGDIEL